MNLTKNAFKEMHSLKITANFTKENLHASVLRLNRRKHSIEHNYALNHKGILKFHRLKKLIQNLFEFFN